MEHVWALIFLMGLLMIAAEAFVFTFGVLAFTGAVMFYMGLHMVSLQSQVFGMAVNDTLIGTLGFIGVAVFIVVSYFAFKAYNHRAKPLLEGEPVSVIEWAGLRGKVRLAGGEIWDAVSTKSFIPGDTAQITKIDNLTLTIA